ncbi:MAG: YHYH protein [Burkholderiales bacterium]|nr:YHYH protein [Betaproteobacteria bacterium]
MKKIMNTKTMAGYSSLSTLNWLNVLFLVLVAAVASGCGGGGNSSLASSPVVGVSTAGILCNYSSNVFNNSPSVNATAQAVWGCSPSQRILNSNGLPDHPVGIFPNPGNPNAISVQAVSFSAQLSPTLSGATLFLNGPRGTGYALNGIKMEAGTGGLATCDNTGTTCSLTANVGPWLIEALGQTAFNFGVDENYGHVQPDGAYHYHGLPKGFIDRLGKGVSMTLIGWAADGFPVYARYGYTSAGDAASPLKIIQSSYRIKAMPDANRPSTSLFAMGTFLQDYEYVAGLGDLDECNGRTGVTPEFPNGIYHYYATDSYPYLQRCVKGRL